MRGKTSAGPRLSRLREQAPEPIEARLGLADLVLQPARQEAALGAMAAEEVLKPRQFLQSAADSRNGARELLQIVFTAELLAPSRCLWIVSPWLRDIPVLDNTTGAFVHLSTDFPRSEVRLSAVLRELVTRGTSVVIATRPEPGNRQVIDGLHGIARQGAVVFHERAELHAKGIVGDADRRAFSQKPQPLLRQGGRQSLLGFERRHVRHTCLPSDG